MEIKELVQIIELYKKGKLTKHTVEQELSRVGKKIIGTGINFSAEITDNTGGSTVSTYLSASRPSITNTESLTILLDADAVNNVLTAEEVVKVFVCEASNHQKILKEYSKFLIIYSNEHITISDALEVFITLYKISVAAAEIKIPEIVDKLRTKHAYPTLEELNKELELVASGDEKIDAIMERLTIGNIVPTVFVKRAKEAAVKIRDDYRKFESYSTKYSDEEPNTNVFTKQRAGVTDGKYRNIKGKEIAHDYKPSTNQ